MEVGIRIPSKVLILFMGMNLRKLVRDVILETKADISIERLLKKAKFSNLPLEFQIAVVIYCQEGVGELWIGIDDDSPITNWWTDQRVPRMIENYKKRHGFQDFLYGYIPTELLISKVDHMVKNPSGYFPFKDFGEYHNDYQSKYRVDHGSSVLPVILYPNGGFMNEPIEDGWHRFHSYVAKGLRDIPVLMFKN